MEERSWGVQLDFLGFIASFICSIHCAAIPFVLTLTAIGGFSWLSDPIIESGFLLASLTIAGSTLIHGYRRETIDKTALILFVSGFSLLILSRLLPHTHGIELVFAVVGGMTIASAHIYHWLGLRRARRCEAVV